MNNYVTATAEKIFACYMEYIHAEKVIAFTNPKEETIIAPLVEPLEQAQVDVLPVYTLAVQQCQVVHQMLEKAFEKYPDNDAISTNMHRSHWFMGLLYCKMNLLDKAKAHYTAAIQTQKEYFSYLMIEVKPISNACLAYLDNTDPRADTCKTMSGKNVIDELQYDRMDPETFVWVGGLEYFNVHYAICKTLNQQQVAPETIIQALLMVCTYVMDTYNKSKEYDKLAIATRVLCKIHALLSGDTPITSDCLTQLMKELSAIYILKLNPTDKYTDLQEAYQACLDLHEHALNYIYLNVSLDCAIELGEHAAKEGDKQGMYTYYSAAYQFRLECARPNIYPDGDYDMDLVAELAEYFAREFDKKKMYNEALEFYKKCDNLSVGSAFDIASIYLALHRLDDALAYYHEGDVYANIDRDAALKIDQITSILRIEENPEVVHAYRERFYAHCGLSEDAKWLDLTNDYWITYTIREGETIIGYCCITRCHLLREFYIDEPHQHKMPEILRQMVDIKLVKYAVLSTTHKPAYSVCLSESYANSEFKSCYTYSGKAIPEGGALDMQPACEEDIEKIKDWYQKTSRYYREDDEWPDLVKRGELYLYTEGDKLVALGECITDGMPKSAQVRITVALDYRGSELGTQLLTFLTNRAIDQGRCPICAVGEFDHYGTKSLVERCGFERTAVFKYMRL